MSVMQEARNIKNIIFDMGNVLIRFEPDLFIGRYNLTAEEKRVLLNEIYRSPEWIMLDRGTLDESGMEMRVLPRIPESLHKIACELIEQWDNPLLPVEGSIELVKQLKSNGYRLYLFSNACARQHVYWKKAEVSSLFDGKLISADAKMLKPEAEIYHVLFKKFSLNPAECLFIDDTVPNIEAGMREGMDGIVFNKDMEELKRKLVLHGVNI